MARISFPLQTYALPSLPASAQDLLNLYAEPAPKESRSPVIVKPTPGLVPLLDLQPGPIRALDATLPGRLYAVSGDQFIRYTQEAQPVSIGTVGASGRPIIAVGPTAVVVCTPPHAYVASHNLDATLQQIELPFPDGASSVAYLNGYWIFTRASSGSDQFFWSGILDPQNYSGLDFASADARPNVIRRAVTHRGELWLFGDQSAEVWVTSGDAKAPFARRGGGDIPFGCAAAATIAECDNSLFWLGTNGVVYRSNGYVAERVSTFAIEEWIRDFGEIQSATGLSYLQTGHFFYALSFERADGAKRTWVYDAATKLWHRRASDADGTGRWRADCSTQFGGTAVFGDRATSGVYGLDRLVGTDAGTVLRRLACFPPLWSGGRRGFIGRFEVECDAGSQAIEGAVTLDWSDDGGRSYGPSRVLSTGAAGQFRKRVFATRLGSYRQRIMRVQTSQPMTFYGAEVQGPAGASDDSAA